MTDTPHASLLDARTRTRRFTAAMAALLIFTLVFAAVAIGLGRYSLSLADVLSVFMPDLFDKAPSRTIENIVLSVRLPRIALALAAGAGLAVSGAAFQALFSNPLASPDTLGVATGASFGAVLAILWEMGGRGSQLMSLASGLAAVFFVLAISRVRGGGNSILMFILAGMVVGAFFTALVSLVKFVADPEDVLPSITFWMIGSLTGSS